MNYVDTVGPLLDAGTADRLAETFRALADPTRLRILSALTDRECSVGGLADALGMTHSAVSHQLGLLRRMRLVRARRAGRRVFYTLDDEHIRDLFQQGLEHVQHT
mgnify:CR=1 FL=1